MTPIAAPTKNPTRKFAPPLSLANPYLLGQRGKISIVVGLQPACHQKRVAGRDREAEPRQKTL